VNEHIPYRLHFVEMGIFSCFLINRGAAKSPGPLSVAGWTFQSGSAIFLDMAIESAMIYCRVLLNFLGIYKKHKRRALESRGPHHHFRESEVWIERFPSGRLLSTRELCRPWAKALHPLTVRARLIDTLHAGSRGVAHLTVPSGRELKISKVRVSCLLTTCMATRHHIKEHFYHRTLEMPHPKSMDTFDELILKNYKPV
jgi:hypothetical protein